MSKIAELLKLAEKKKEDTKIEISAPVIPKIEDGVSKRNQEEVSRSNVAVKQVEVSTSKGNYEQPSVIKSKDGEVRVNRGNDNINNNIFPKPIETSPARDYTKVSNSIMKRAIPEKYFRGLSKHTYDVLYQKTRGAIVPTRTIQLTKDELVRLTGISKDAIKLHIKYLKETGLLKSRPAIGSHAGWEYEILVPEEIEETVQQVGVRQDKARQGKASENLPLHSGQNLPPLTHTNPVENKGTYEFPKTSLKTNTKNDDEAAAAFSELNEKLAAAVKKITGKNVSEREAGKWSDLADLLILELEVAARKTGGVSSVPAFLTEVLRRQFFAAHRRPAGKSSKEVKKDTVGKSETDGSYEIKPLDEQGREAALEQLREFFGDKFFLDFEKWYTAEDWKWITEQLKS
jgi:hypothetical protein